METLGYPTLAAASEGSPNLEVGDHLSSSTLVNNNSIDTPTLTPRPVTPYPKSTTRPRLLSVTKSDSRARSVSLPNHPPHSPLSNHIVFQFPPIEPIGKRSADLVTPRNSVIEVNPNSRSESELNSDVCDPNVNVDYDFGLLRSRTPSYEWDHYSPEPDYFKVRKESTDPNILDSTYQLAPAQSNFELIGDNLYTMDELNNEISRLRTLRGNLLRRMNLFTPDDVTEELVHEVDPELKAIHDMFDTYINGVEDLLRNYKESLNDTTVASYNKDIEHVTTEFKKHKKSILIAKKAVCPPPASLSGYETKMLELQLQSLEIQKSAAAKIEDDKVKKGELLVVTKTNEFNAETNVLGDLLMDENWEEADNIKVSQAMRQTCVWQTQMNPIERKYTEFQNLSEEYKFSTDKTESVDNEYKRIRDIFDKTKKAVTEQDTERGLFTLEPAKTEKVKFPIFTGQPAEDYMKWKEKMENAFLKNRVPKDERVDKLREFLKGKALALVPETTKNIDAAYTVLKDAFGDPARVLDHKLLLLEDLGPFPQDKSGRGFPPYGKQVDWLLKAEGIVRDIYDLGESYKELDRDAFSTNTLKRIVEKFPEKMIVQFNKLFGDGKTKLLSFQSIISEKRAETQGLDNTCGTTKSKIGGAADSITKKSQPFNDKGKYDASVFFKEPQTFNDCRICNTLSTEGITTNLFVNHLSNYATGCPNFIQMSVERRKTVSRKAKFCSRCFHPDTVWTKAHEKECTFSQGKRRNKYSCSNLSCKDHMWICVVHRSQNKRAMEKFKFDLAKKGLNLAYGVQVHLHPEEKSGHFGTQVKDPVAGAVKKLKRSLKNAAVVDVPIGDPMFMFFGANGRTRPLNTFIDNGCSHAVFNKLIPGQELKGQLIQNGPFDIGGVGGAKVMAHGEWVCSMDRLDGRKQLVQGLTVDKVTSTFPLIDISEAVKEVQNNDPNNRLLQDCKLPQSIGGAVDILLGIKYASVFPVPVHTLDSGLTIYSTRLAPFHKSFNAIIGGPHSSFKFLADKAGNASMLMAHFVQGLQDFRNLDGAPRIKDYYVQESIENQRTSFWEMHDIHTCSISPDYDSDQEENYELSSVPATQDEPVLNHNCSLNCSVCTAADERLSSLKRILGSQEVGLEIEYRCVRCRECSQCKNADKSEKISLREEAEMVEIRNSVKLDFKNRQILCSLPLRGKEEDFLSSNRFKALKVLNQQCEKYSNDAETKEAIVKAFQKLMDKGHAVKLDSISTELKNEFLSKPVQYHIPWRVVFKLSPTTPARPVLDASSGTLKRDDGTGGRCLNDLVVKGKIETLQLVNLLLRFTVGQFGFTGDLSQFYNSCKLVPQQWNSQRFLFKENLDPNSPVIEYILTTLIYGVKCVSAQTEHAMFLLAQHIKEDYPDLANFLIKSRYCDDMADSKSSLEGCLQIISDADYNFKKVGLESKVWTISGQDPDEKASIDGVTVGVGGLNWLPKIDAIEVKIPLLHFNKKRRGKLPEDTKFFDIKTMTIDDFVPKKLNRRQVTSKLASVFDVMGHLAPVLSGLKSDLRNVVKNTANWNDAMPSTLRNKWLDNFLKLERLRGIKFHRPVMPADALNCKMRLLVCVDAAKENLIIGTWGGFR